jgi:hypothetical protein
VQLDSGNQGKEGIEKMLRGNPWLVGRIVRMRRGGGERDQHPAWLIGFAVS